MQRSSLKEIRQDIADCNGFIGEANSAGERQLFCRIRKTNACSRRKPVERLAKRNVPSVK
jgi:hypothetical protein